MPFIHDDFLLQNEPARRIYHEIAAKQPILDYHNHLPPQEIAENRRFANLYETWLEADHYKWRAMRAAGVEEAFCTGDAPAKEKYYAWARTVPQTIRNPLYHWTHLELKRYFGIDDLLSESSAEAIWDAAGDRLAAPEFCTQQLLQQFGVRALCTTDDPADSLDFHHQIAASDLPTRVYPTFRTDKAVKVDQPQEFNAWLDRLAATCNIDIRRLSQLFDALRQRHDDFHAIGGRLSDHSMQRCYAQFPSDEAAAAIFDKVRAGTAASPAEHEQFAAHVMLFLGKLDAEKGWTKQLHIGVHRNWNTRRHAELGPDTGFDSIIDLPQAEALGRYLDQLEQEDALPKMVLYNLNPSDNYTFATMVGNFQDGKTAGKVQWGAGWWYLDQKDGIEWQLNDLSRIGLLSHFLGMLTDSRSFLSFPRHEYFRRILCNVIGQDIVKGEIPDDDALVGPLIRDICYGNAKRFLGLEVP